MLIREHLSILRMLCYPKQANAVSREMLHLISCVTDCQAQNHNPNLTVRLAQYGFSSCTGRVTYSVRHQPL